MEKEENIEIEKISETLKKNKTDDGTFYGSLYDLYVLINIARSIDNINHGHFMTLEESKERMMRKYETYNRRFGS